ncbi:MAG: S-layer homology domain-containing protein, partial [Candidatus Margulisbacteria bacterium]|nr:S-layer homology domain-containing protein [Candidatus Margulisiibacteriota bacterium]
FILFFILSWGVIHADANFLLSFSPEDLAHTDKASILIQGQVNNEITELKINGKKVDLEKDGSFSAQVQLKSAGKYILRLLAIDKNAKRYTAEKRILKVISFQDLNASDKIDQKIQQAAAADLLSVFPDQNFQPNNNITRAEVAMIIAKAKDYSFSSPSEALKVLIRTGIMSSVPGEETNLAKWVSRAEGVKIAVKLNAQLLRKNIEAPPFIDVPLSHWSVGYIDIAQKLGWLNALVEKNSLKFQPLLPITRKEMVALLTETTPFQEKIKMLNDWSYTKDIKTAIIFPISTRKLVSMDFTNVDIRLVLKVFAKETGINVVLGKEVMGNVSAHFKDVEPMVALQAILKSSGCTYYVEGDNLLRISKPKNKMDANKTPENYIKTYTINYADINKLSNELMKLVPSLKGKILIGESSNSLIIDGRHPEIKKITEIIDRLDAPPLQVMVEAQIFELSLDDQDSFGTNIYENNNQNDTGQVKTIGFANDAPGATYKGLFVKVLKGDTEAFLNALRSRSDFELLSSPKIMAINNQEAALSTGEDVGYQDETTTYTTGGSVTSKTTKFAHATTELKFTPHISKDGFIMIDLQPVISEVALDANGVPTIKTTDAHTQVVVADGQTFIIGGLIKDKIEEVTNEVPILGSIPWIGNFFKSKSLVKRKRHITVMVTPHIIDAFHAENMSNEINNVKDTHQEFRQKREGSIFN